MKLLMLVGICSSVVCAQGITEPPALLRVTRSPGLYSLNAEGYASVGAAIPVIGMTTLTGSAETWLVEGQDSFSAIEQLDRARPQLGTRNLQGENGIGQPETWIAAYRQDLSYRPREAVQNLPKARYFQISLYRIQPGSEQDFVEFVTARKATRDSINVDRPDLAYQVISGAPAGTYLVLLPLARLASLDDALAVVPPYAHPAAREARKIVSEGEISRQNLLLRTEPDLSHVPDDFAGADRTFWKPQAK